MDIYDHASEVEQRDRDLALRAQKMRMPVGRSATHCQAQDCAIPIPKKRQIAIPGVRFCIDCQQLKERFGK